jgi:hypothetical protein
MILSYLFKVLQPCASEADELINTGETLVILHDILKFRGDPLLRTKDQDTAYMELVHTYIPNTAKSCDGSTQVDGVLV